MGTDSQTSAFYHCSGWRANNLKVYKHISLPFLHLLQQLCAFLQMQTHLPESRNQQQQLIPCGFATSPLSYCLDQKIVMRRR